LFKSNSFTLQLFESADLLALSQRLNSLKQSLDLLSHVTDYSDRLLQLDGLRNRLEALASPHLVAAVSANDAAKAKNLVQVTCFCAIVI
jgi:conserved oligomeric Golgi complex subunit 7